MELAPSLKMCRRIVDLVSTGKTLKANGLKEIEKIMDVNSKLIVNRSAYKTKTENIEKIISSIKKVIKWNYFTIKTKILFLKYPIS